MAIDGGTTGAIAVLIDVRPDTEATHLSDKAPGVVVLFGAKGFLVGTGEVCCHRFCGIPFIGAHGLRHLAIDDRGMAVVYEHMDRVARLGRLSVGLTGQQGFRICVGAVGLVDDFDATEITLGSLLPSLGGSKPLPRS